MRSVTTTRAARGDDYPDFARWFPHLETGDPTPDRTRWEQRFVPETVIAERDGAPVGYLFAQVWSGAGYVRNVVVDPEARGQGVGRRLMEAAAARLRAAGCSRWRLNVRPENVAAVELYRSLGLQPAYASASLRFPWEVVDSLPRPDRALRVAPPTTAGQACLEQRFDLPVGQLAKLARTPGVAVRGLFDPERPEQLDLGVAAFDGGVPGCFPFRVQTSARAIDLLRGLRPLARLPVMGVVAEDDTELESMLLGAGAQVLFRFVHLMGPLTDP